jgi:hypothetical protein
LVLVFVLSLWKAEGRSFFEDAVRTLSQGQAKFNAFDILKDYINAAYLPLIKTSIFIYLYVCIFSAFMLLWLVYFKFVANIIFSIFLLFFLNIIFSLPLGSLKDILGIVFPDIRFYDFFYFNKYIFSKYSVHNIFVSDIISSKYMLLVLLKTVFYSIFYVIVAGYLWSKSEIKTSD